MITKKKKLLIIVGAGASIDFGMPSVGAVHALLLQAAQSVFALEDDPTKNLYGYLYDEIQKYWSASIPQPLNKWPNFEDVLYAISALSSIAPAGVFTGTLGAFVDIRSFPEVIHIGQKKKVDKNVLRHLSSHLVDALLEDFRSRCKAPIPNIHKLSGFFSALDDAFDIAVLTTNYDDLVHRSLPNLETGFDPTDGGVFKQGRILARQSWPCMLHLHGSVHFDMDLVNGEIHAIKWQNTLGETFHQNAFGRSSVNTEEGAEFPTTCIIAGYGKSDQIERAPFRTYYSELDRLVYQSEAILSLGFGFGDSHVRQAFTDYRDGRDRPVVIIDWANDKTMTAGSGCFDEPSTASRALRIFRAYPHEMTWLGNSHPSNVAPLIAQKEFERCVEPGRRLSIWYNGMLEACLNSGKIVDELLK